MSAQTELILPQGPRLPAARRSRLQRLHQKVVPDTDTGRLFFFLILLHVPLGVLMYNFRALAIVHPIAVVLLGLYRAVQVKEPIERVAYVVAYLVGVEVLWRMAEAPVYWEMGKYASSAIMIVALLRRGLARIPTMPLLYLLLLLPGCVASYLADNNWTHTRARLSFNMSGPLALFVSCWFFSQMKLNSVQVKKLLLSIATPLVSVAVATLFFTVTNPYLEFTNESNPMTSGGFGPNQVSAMLGLGAFVAAACLLLFRNDLRASFMFGVLALLFTAQSVLTFSRGGIYAAIGGLVMLAIFQARDFGQFLGRFLPVLAVIAIFLLLVFPNLNEFTGGKLEERFADSDTTNRLSIVEMELQVFMEHPFLGVGVGEAIDERYQMSHHFAASHTEFTRVLSEHGLLGVLALLALAFAMIHNLRKQSTRLGKALVAGVFVWSGLFMVNAGMRLAAPSFMWGMSFLLVANSFYGSAATLSVGSIRRRIVRRRKLGFRGDRRPIVSEPDK